MTDLPSRDEAKQWAWAHSPSPPGWLAPAPSSMVDIVMAYGEGQLVELPLFDEMVERATNQLGLIDWIELQTRHPSSVEMPPYEWLQSEAIAVLEAALGVQKGYIEVTD